MELRSGLSVRKMLAQIRKQFVGKSRERSFLRSLVLQNGNGIFIVGSPQYGNLGDSAIFLAQKYFLQDTGIQENRIKEITYGEYYQFRQALKSVLTGRPLFCMGGGNMGNQWIWEELLRYNILADYPESRIVIFPQTVFFSETGNPVYTKERSKVAYNGRRGLTLVAREAHTYNTMLELYPDTQVLMTPDIVLSATMNQFGAMEQPRSGVLLCCRNDAERVVSIGTWDYLEKAAASLGKSVSYTDMDTDDVITKENRRERVREKMQEFCGAELVITDRLHGMVFAALTGTPCIVFSNYNHKIKGTYDWISYLPYIRYTETVEQAENWLPELLNMKNCKYDNAPLKPYFDKLKEVVIEACR